MDSLVAQVLRAVDILHVQRIGWFYHGVETVAYGYTRAGTRLIIVGPSPALMPGLSE
ncbi:hypothetical protein M1D68_09270 [Pseudomonas sp. R4-84]|uniref:hypothetical protein n=1 Tax=Pseudomonas sp. NR3 TaxID=3155978 RepID=UPI003B66DC38